MYYELAVRHWTRKPIVQIIDRIAALKFDVLTQRTIEFDLSDPDSIHECQLGIVAQARYADEHPNECSNPIADAVNLNQLAATKKPLEAATAKTLRLVQALATRLLKSPARGIDLQYIDYALDEFNLLATLVMDHRAELEKIELNSQFEMQVHRLASLFSRLPTEAGLPFIIRGVHYKGCRLPMLELISAEEHQAKIDAARGYST